MESPDKLVHSPYMNLVRIFPQDTISKRVYDVCVDVFLLRVGFAGKVGASFFLTGKHRDTLPVDNSSQDQRLNNSREMDGKLPTR